MINIQHTEAYKQNHFERNRRYHRNGDFPFIGDTFTNTQSERKMPNCKQTLIHCEKNAVVIVLSFVGVSLSLSLCRLYESVSVSVSVFCVCLCALVFIFLYSVHDQNDTNFKHKRIPIALALCWIARALSCHLFFTLRSLFLFPCYSSLLFFCHCHSHTLRCLGSRHRHHRRSHLYRHLCIFFSKFADKFFRISIAVELHRVTIMPTFISDFNAISTVWHLMLTVCVFIIAAACYIV